MAGEIRDRRARLVDEALGTVVAAVFLQGHTTFDHGDVGTFPAEHRFADVVAAQ